MNKRLFESFNARPIEAEFVGRSFVYNSTFRRLASSNNSVVIGPRGSGKTTYFKMLTLPALRSWKSPQKGKLLERIDYNAIYVPTDFSWFPDFRHPVGLMLEKETDDILSYARFRNSVLRGMVTTIADAKSPRIKADPNLRRYAVELDRDAEEFLCRRLAKSWMLEPDFGGLDGIIEAINIRNRQIQRMLAAAYYSPDRVRERIETLEFLQDRIFDDLSSFADAVESTTKREHRWAVCFDEVEIAPDSIKVEIWKSLRSFDQRFLIKLSASPYDESIWKTQTSRSAAKDNDYEEIWLLQNRTDIQEFSRKLFSGLCSELGIPPQRQKILLGPSYYDDDFDFSLSLRRSRLPKSDATGVSKKNVKKDGFYTRKFSSLSRKDQSFSEYLDRVGIQPENFRELSGNRRAFVRKFISTVVIRDAYLREAGTKRRVHLASKKAIDRFYTGQTTIFTICEGNPRWLLVVLRPMLEQYAQSREYNVSTINRELQAQCLEDGVSTLLSILSTVAPVADGRSDAPTLLEIIEKVGDYFFEEVLGPEFVAEPYLSFTVDDAVDDSTLKLLGAAVNQGALVLIPGSRNPRSVEIKDKRTLRGQRLRLSYYLAARYRLPLVVGRSRDLTSILTERRSGSASEEQIMLDLFGE